MYIHTKAELVCVSVVFWSVCVFTFTSHVNAAGVSCSVLGHVTDTCRHRVQRWATNRSLSRHEPACFSSLVPPPSLPPSLSPSLPHTFTLPLNTLHFPSSLPLSLPPSFPRQSRPGLGARAQAVPCRDHMDSGVLLSRAHNVVPAQQVWSRLTSHTATTTHNNHNASVAELNSQGSW